MSVEYKLLNIPKMAGELMAVRTPRVQPSAQHHFVDHVSWMVASDMWTLDPVNGQPLSYEGKTLEQVCEDWLSTRPNALEPVELVDTSGECWTEGNISKQGQRLKELIAFTGSEKAALVLFAEEAALYGTKPGSTAKGVKPDPKAKPGADKKPAGSAGGANNPWSPDYRGDNAEAEKSRLLRTLGTKGCASIAAAAGFSVLGARLK
jgi:hypothetical protein